MTTNDHKDDTAQIRKLLAARAAAISAKSADDLVAQQTPDFAVFSLAPPLRDESGVGGLKAWFATWDGPIGYDLHEVSIDAGSDVAYARYFTHLVGRKTDGSSADLWFRSTTGFRKVDGVWKIAHDHDSVPFYMDGSYKAAIDLKP
jgi:PhnB protein